ncbi:MAG: hypothetical protein KY455_11705 [Euryarchaeota archaeon]|nr:hypothetical protein [Euryarchaeota archaeon]
MRVRLDRPGSFRCTFQRRWRVLDAEADAFVAGWRALHVLPRPVWRIVEAQRALALELRPLWRKETGHWEARRMALEHAEWALQEALRSARDAVNGTGAARPLVSVRRTR